MELLIGVAGPGAAPGECADVLVRAQEGATVADLARALAGAAPGGARGAGGAGGAGAPDPVVVALGSGEGAPGAPPAPALWVGDALLDPGARLEEGVVRDGALVGLEGPAPDVDEPGGVMELRVVGGPGAGRVHRLGLGEYTVGGAGCDVVIPGADRPLVRVRVEAGARVRVEAMEGAADLRAPARPVRARALPGPLVLRRRGAEEAGESDEEAPSGRDEARGGRRGRWGRRGGADRVALPDHEELDPDAPRRLVELDRRALSEPAAWTREAVLSLGRTQLIIGPVPAADAVVTASRGAPTLDFNRPPRLARPARSAVFTVPQEPTAPRKQPFSPIMLLAPLVMGGVTFFVTHRVMSLLFMLLSPLMMIGNRLATRSGAKKMHREAVARFREQKREAERAAFRALVEERRARRLDHPDAAEVMLRATGPRAGLWERRIHDPDWLDLRVGTADLPSEVELRLPDRAGWEEPFAWSASDVPVSVPLGRLGVAGVAGEKRREVARWMLAQCAVLHSPAELDLMVLVDPGLGARAGEEWAWTCWLPHARAPEGTGARVRAAMDEDTIARQVGALVSLIERRQEAAGAAGGAAPGPFTLVVLDGARALRLVPGMVRVLREGPAAGIRLLCLDEDRVSLPEECRAVVAADEPWASVSQTDKDDIEQVSLDLVPAGWAQRVARALAPLRDVSAQGDAGAIPRSSRLLDVIGMPEPDAAAVLSRWQGGRASTRAVIGEDAEGLFSLDVRADGPHALVAGTTGSGKSELLQTLIASLCALNTPESMTFVLVDYKGGAAFKDCARLPHTVGMVTDLDGHLTGRALESLGAELRRRERLLARADAKDIEDYTAALEPGDEPMPRLMLIIDEFAALVAELPDFVTGLVDIARRGRSLGVHLVLATQRPAGVVSAEIKSNTNLRIALRVTDEGDSQDVVESGASAHIPPSIPGRAYARLGHGRLLPFQASRVGGRPTGAVRTAAPSLEPLTLEGMSRPAPSGPVIEEDVSVPTDLAALVDAMLQARRTTGLPAPHRPWLEPLPALITLDRVGGHDDAPADADGAPGFLPPLVIGLEDLPGEQAQRPMTWDYTRAGHLGVAGAPRSGRSNLLRTLAVEIARTASPADVHVYGLDAGSGALAPLVSMAHTGAVVTRDQADRVRRLLTMLGKEVARRQQALALEGFSSLAEQRAAAPAGERLPYLVVLLDRWDGFLAVFETVDGGVMVSAFETLMREGAAVGVRVVVTGDRTAFRGRTGMLLEDRLVLRMPAADDYELVGMRAREAPASMPAGRAFRSGPHPREVQIAVLDADPSGTAQTAAFYLEARAADERWGRVPDGLRPARVDDLPLAITAAQALELGPVPGPGWIPLGVGGDTLAVRSVSMEDVGNGVLITGPRRSGRSTALAFALQSALDNGTRTILILPRRSPLTAWADHPGVVAMLDSTATAAQLTELIGKDRETLVVVDDYEVLGNDHALTAPLEAHVKGCRDSAGGVLVACNIDEAQGLYRGFMTTVRKNRTGLLLAPRAPDDGNIFSTRLPRSVGAPAPLGRAIMITTQGWAWVQVPHAADPRTGPADL